MQRKIFEHADFKLDYDDLVAETTESGRKYFTPDGKAYPSITTVLSILSAKSIAAWRKRVGEKQANAISRQATGRGEDVHAIIEKYLDNDPNYAKGYLPHIVNSFKDLQPIFDSRIGKIYAQEAPLYSDHLGCAGRVDCVAEFDGQISIIDFKTSTANAISRQATGRGEDVHAIIEKYLDNDPNYAKGYLPHIVNSFKDLQPIFDSRIGKIYAQEAPLYSDHLGCAGRVDCVAEFDGQISIIDFKTSRRHKTKDKIHNYFMQESAYAIMWEERTGMPITQLVTIMTIDHYEPQVFIEHRDNWTDQLKNVIGQFKRLV